MKKKCKACCKIVNIGSSKITPRAVLCWRCKRYFDKKKEQDRNWVSRANEKIWKEDKRKRRSKNI